MIMPWETFLHFNSVNKKIVINQNENMDREFGLGRRNV